MTAEAPKRWTPEPWTEEVCCMKGMPCYTGAFENEAYRQQIVRDLDQYRVELANRRAEFDELDAENQREIAAQRQIDLTDSKKLTLKLTN
jgi:hypothetical protein